MVVLHVDLETTKYTRKGLHVGELNHGVATPLFWVRGALRAGLHVWNNTMNTRRCVELFVTQGFAHEKPTHLRSM